MGPLGRRLLEAGVEVDEELAPSRSDLLQIRDLIHYLREHPPDVLYFLDHTNALFYAGLASRFVGRIPAALGVHQTGRADGSPSLSLVDRLMLSRIAAVIALSAGHAQYLEEVEQVSAAKLRVISNGVDTSRFRPIADDARRLDARSRFKSIPADDIWVAMVAALRPEKNHELAIEALAQAEHPARLLVVGDGPRREALQAHAQALGVAESVHFLGRQNDIQGILGASDLLMLSSHPRVETFPLCVLEAMAAGLPVVATDVGSLGEMIVDGETGRLVPAGDVRALRTALDELVGDAALRQRWGSAARERAVERFSIERMIDEQAALLRELAGR